jgi:hypothetical protein
MFRFSGGKAFPWWPSGPRDGGRSGKKLLEKCHAQLVRTVFGTGKRDLEGQELGGIKSWINANQADKTANEQAGAGEQDESQAQRSNHEGMAREGPATGGGGAADGFLEGFRDARMR